MADDIASATLTHDSHYLPTQAESPSSVLVQYMRGDSRVGISSTARATTGLLPAAGFALSA